MAFRRGIHDGYWSLEPYALGFSSINHPHRFALQDAVSGPTYLYVSKLIRMPANQYRGRDTRASQQPSTLVVNRVHVVAREAEFRRIDHHIVVRVFGVLDRTQQGVGPTLQAYIQRMQPYVPLIQ